MQVGTSAHGLLLVLAAIVVLLPSCIDDRLAPGGHGNALQGDGESMDFRITDAPVDFVDLPEVLRVPIWVVDLDTWAAAQTTDAGPDLADTEDVAEAADEIADEIEDAADADSDETAGDIGALPDLALGFDSTVPPDTSGFDEFALDVEPDDIVAIAVVGQPDATEADVAPADVPVVVDVQAIDVPAVVVKDIQAIDVLVIVVKDIHAIDVPAVEVKDAEAIDVPVVEAKDVQALDVPVVEVKDVQTIDVPVAEVKDVQASEVQDAKVVDVQDVASNDAQTSDVPEVASYDVAPVGTGSGGIKGPTVLPWPIKVPSAFAPAKKLFDPTGYHTVELSLSATNWKAFMAAVMAHASSGKWYPAEVTVDGVTYKNVGIRQFGYGSMLSNPQKPNVRIDFDQYVKQKGPAGVKTLRLKASGQDTTFLRQPLFQAAVNQLGGSAPRWSFARVTVNDEFYGPYQVFEEPDKTMYKDFFGNSGGSAYESDKSCQGLNCPGGTCSAIKKYYESKEGNFSDLVALVTAIDESAGESWLEGVAAHADVDNFLAYEAMEAYASDIDGLASAGQNYAMYGDKVTGALHLIPTGPDLTFGNWGAWFDFDEPWSSLTAWCDDRTDHFYAGMWQDPVGHAMLLAKFQAIRCKVLPTTKTLAMIDGYRKLLGPDLYDDPKGDQSKAAIDASFSGLKSWISKRNKAVEKLVGPCP